MNELRTLGSFALQIEGRIVPALATQKARAILVYLVAHRDRNTSRDTLVDLFWPDADPERARKSLNTALWSIRKALRDGGVDPDAHLQADKLAVRWVGDLWYDAEAFERERRPELYRGEFLEGDYEEWAVTERERLASVFEASLQSAVESGESVEAARLLLARDPYNVRAYEMLIAHELSLGRGEAAQSLLLRAQNALSEIDGELARDLEERFSGQIRAAAPQRDLTLPFAGRRNELDAFARLHPPYPIVLVHGIPGAGKSTLLEHLVRESRNMGKEAVAIDAPDQDVRVFGPWERLYEQRTQNAFEQFIAGAGQTPAAALATQLSQTFDANAVLIVDNVQFLSGDALEVFVRLARALRAKDVLVVAACRPEAIARMRAEFGAADAVEWEIGALSSTDLRAALASVGGLQFEELADALHARSEGHALFAARLLDYLVERGVVAHEGGRWRYNANERTSREIPVSLRRFIEARLRSCGESAVLVACVLALDPDADADQIVAASGIAEAPVYDALDELLAHGFIVAPDRGPQFAFSHDLIRETAQTLLAPQRRAAIHRRFAEMLASAKERGTAIRRARHLAAGRRFEEALPYFEAAVFEASEWHAYAESERIAHEALQVAASLADEEVRERNLNLFKRVLSFIALLRQSPEAVSYATEALQHARRAKHRQYEMFAYSARAQAHGVVTHDFRAMLADVDALMDLARELNSKTGASLGHILRGYGLFALGDAKGAIDEYEAGYAIGIESDNLQSAVTAAESLSRVHAAAFDFARSLEALGRAAACAANIGRLAQALTREYAAFVLSVLERLPESIAAARHAYREAVEVATLSVETRRLFTPPDQLQFWSRAALVDALLVCGDEAAARTELATLRRLPHAERNDQTKAVCAMLEARIDPAPHLLEPLAQAGRIYETWFSARQPFMQHALLLARLGDPAAGAALEEAFAEISERGRSTPADSDRVLADIASAAAALGLAQLHDRSVALGRALRERRLQAAAAFKGVPIPV